MLDRKGKGTNAERELIHMFWANDWAAVRVAGSGSSRYPSPDIVASNNQRKLAVECKSTKELSKYLNKAAVEQLKTFALKFGAEPWLAVRFDKIKWFFLSLEDLKETEKGFAVSEQLARSRGLLFEELIKF